MIRGAIGYPCPVSDRTPPRYLRVFLTIALVITGLLGRALIDKILAIRGGAVAVAEWAQLSSVADLVANVSMTGIGTALTVLAAGTAHGDRLAWMKPALAISFVVSFSVAAIVLPLLLATGSSLVPVDSSLLAAAVAAGLFNLAPGVLGCQLLGTGNVGRATVFTILAFLPPLVLALWAPFAVLPANLLMGQVVFGGATAIGLAWALRGQAALSRDALKTLMRFVPAGLAIGIMSPTATVWARSEIAGSLAWNAVGQVQAIWRASDWVTAIAAGLLNAYVLPRLSAAGNRPAFFAELRTAAAWIVLPAGATLLLLWLALPDVLAVLYRADLGVGRRDAALFLLGDWVRVVSWVGLFGLFARRAAWGIAVGEFLSLPLFALLLTFAGPADLHDIGLLWLVTYAIYAAFNGWVLYRGLATLPRA